MKKKIAISLYTDFEKRFTFTPITRIWWEMMPWKAEVERSDANAVAMQYNAGAKKPCLKNWCKGAPYLSIGW
jgi:hypothetical protein